MLKKFATINNIMILLILVVLVMLPRFITSNYYLRVGTFIFFYAFLGIAWNLIGGYGGQLSLGHGAFASLGAYTAVILTLHFGILPYFGVFAGMAVTAVMAYFIGMLTFGLRGPYFTLATLAFNQIVMLLLLFFRNLTGGALGATIPFRGEAWKLFAFRNESPYYYSALAILLLYIYIAYRFERSKIGWYLFAIKNDQDAAAALGIDLRKWKLKAFVLSAVLTSIGGTFFAYYVMYIDPYVFNLDFSVRIILTAILGGLGTVIGPIIGAAIMVPITEASNAWFGAGRAGAALFVYGALIVSVILISPNGIMHIVKESAKKSRQKKLRKQEQAKAGIKNA